MYSKELDSKPSYRPWFSKADAEARNTANKSLYGPKQLLEAERVRLALGLVYHNRGIYINYRDRFIAVKVDRAQTIRGQRLEREVLEKEYETRGYSKRVTAQGVIYRIPRA